MTKYAEIVFEPGSSSVLSYENDDELKAFLTEHRRRAITGEPGAPQDQVERTDLTEADFAHMPSMDRIKSRPAERISKVYLYDKHPADLHDPRLPVNDVHVITEKMVDVTNGRIDHNELTQVLQQEASAVRSGPKESAHDSFYKATPAGELDLAFLDQTQGVDS